ncbi:TlpA family protein disulfide reductase [Sabulilitoribacter arenilitoris]|uniref:TlpA family protein disulfide reductase n=1 Tax=Wocania arenilitoris TaxID=2044858 RepID=A0AAE3JPI4_9FLAO|nr:TlpA disulfide reductase family protein [Wocania arenilitoris]MCF7568285.1 TlpA family protein disulfide reductase [Wocania arenilitoris]
MKNLLLFLSAIVLITSCKKETPIDYAIISGKILNSDAKELSISSADRKIKKKLKIDSEGNFKDTLKVDAGMFSFYDSKNYNSFYAEAGNTIQINYDAKDFKNSLNFSGSGSDVSNYLIEKNKISSELTGERKELFILEEAAFKAKCNEVKKSLENLLSTTNIASTSFKANEIKDINYNYLNYISMYERSHAYYAKIEDFKVSEGFEDELKNIDYNNENDFKFSSIYKGLVSAHYRKLNSDLIKNDSVDRTLSYLKTVSKAPNENIKNTLLFDEAVYSIKYADDVETYYKIFTEASTDTENNKTITEIYNNLKHLSKGKVSPKFVNYTNYAGGRTSLDDLKGKYVYIDVWATWCGPCKYEIPFLKEVEKKYHGKNIHFVSLSVDKIKDKEKWMNMVKDEELTGIQLLANNDFNSDFVKGYMINAIPQFILLDPDGNIVDKNAPRPSSSQLTELFNELNI